jgi:integrase
MARRINGEGTIYRRKDGRYEAKAWVETTSGITKRVSRYGKTRSEAHEKLTAALAQRQQGVPVPDRMPRLGDYLDYWMKNVVRPTAKRTTHRRYEGIVRIYLKPGLGRYSLVRLNARTVQDFLNQKLAEGRSVRNVQIMRQVLSSALSQAMREELLFRNVARLVKLPLYDPDEVKPWTDDEARRFFDAIRNHPLYPVFVLLIVYGVREGEVLGLPWANVDFERGTLYVKQQLQCDGGELYVDSVKTRSGKRMLAIVPLTHQVLRAQQLHQARQRVEAGEKWKGTGAWEGFVFTTRSGLPISPRNFYKSFKRLCEQHGIRSIRVHDLRHTNSTWLKDLDVPERDIQAMLGHANGAMTRHYEHGNWHTSQQATAQVAGMLQGGPKTEMVVKFSRQSPWSVAQMTSIPTKIPRANGGTLVGGPSGIRTHDTRLKSSIQSSLAERIQSVKSFMEGHTRRWLIGVVVVKLSRQLTLSPSTASSPDKAQVVPETQA